MGATGVTSQRKTIEESIERNKEKYIETSHNIHANPEIGNQEFYASRTLSLLLGSAGFQLQHNIAGHETGFIARKSSGKQGPVIAFLAEYDALPGLGHACGHNLIGTIGLLQQRSHYQKRLKKLAEKLSCSEHQQKRAGQMVAQNRVM